MTPLKQNILWGLVISIAFAAIISSALLSRVEDIDDTPMAAGEAGSQVIPVPLLETAGPPPPVYVIWLQPDHLLDFLRYPELRVHILAYDGSAHLTTATIEVLGTDCSYETRSDAGLDNGSLVRFVQSSKCYPLVGNPTGDLKLSVRLADRHRIGVGAFAPIAPGTAQRPGSIRVIGTPDSATGTFPVLRGYYVEYLAPTRTRRIDLLAYMWQIQPATWIWQVVGLACALLLVGALVTSNNQRTEGDKRQLSAGRASLGAGCAAAALGLMYAVLVPPFHAPDEPDHLLSYGQLVNDRRLEPEAQTWARLGHFERIKFRSDERFRPADVGNPFPVAWPRDLVVAVDVRTRSMTTTVWWNVLSRFSRPTGVPRQLLFLRVANVLLFALCVAAAAALLVALAGRKEPHPEMLAFVFLLIPSLPFFAMHVSEFSVLTSVYVVFAACALMIFIGGSRASWIGAPLGLSIAVAIASGRSALPMAPLMIALLCIRAVLGDQSRGSELARSGPLVFWTSLGLGLSAGAWLFAPHYVPSAGDPVPPIAGNTILPALRAAWRPSVLALVAAVGLLLELAVRRLRRLIPSSGEHVVGTAVRWSAFVLAGAVLWSLVWSLFAAFPQLEHLETGHRPSQRTYVLNVLRVAAYWARASQPDLLLSSSFWAGFGWLDAIPGVALVNGMTIGTALLLAVLFIGIGIRGDVRAFASLMFLAAGTTATIAAYAFAAYGMQRNLHGRYLLGVYLTGLAVAFSPLAMTAPNALTALRVPRAAIVLCAIAAIHAYCLSSLLHRYF